MFHSLQPWEADIIGVPSQRTTSGVGHTYIIVDM
jgi:hypothetical protein